MKQALLLKLIFKIVIIAVLFVSQQAEGATAPTARKKRDMNVAATTVPAARAQSDLQIRRLKTLFAADQLDPEIYFNQIRLLQQDRKESRNQ